MSKLREDVYAQLDAYEWAVRRLRCNRYIDAKLKEKRMRDLKSQTFDLLFKSIKESQCNTQK